MDWPAVMAAWDAAWRTLRQAALSKWGPQIQASPGKFASSVQAFDADLRAIETALQRAALALGRLGWPAELVKRWEDQRAVYNDLAAGLRAESHPMSQSSVQGTVEVGVIPAGVVIVIGVVGFTVAGVAWALVAKPYAESLRTQAETAAAELEARVQGRAQGLPPLQASTVPAPGAGGLGSSIGSIIGMAASVAFIGMLGWLAWQEA
jgi:hypothetical protein